MTVRVFGGLNYYEYKRNCVHHYSKIKFPLWNSGTPRGVCISVGETPTRQIDCSDGSERNSNVPWEDINREVFVRVPW